MNAVLGINLISSVFRIHRGFLFAIMLFSRPSAKTATSTMLPRTTRVCMILWWSNHFPLISLRKNHCFCCENKERHLVYYGYDWWSNHNLFNVVLMNPHYGGSENNDEKSRCFTAQQALFRVDMTRLWAITLFLDISLNFCT